MARISLCTSSRYRLPINFCTNDEPMCPGIQLTAIANTERVTRCSTTHLQTICSKALIDLDFLNEFSQATGQRLWKITANFHMSLLLYKHTSFPAFPLSLTTHQCNTSLQTTISAEHGIVHAQSSQ